MKRVLLTALTLAFLTAGLHTAAQVVKDKNVTPAGAKVKTKADADKAKIKAETPGGKETKITAENDKVTIRGEGVGKQFDTAMALASVGGMNLDVVRQEINTNNRLWGQAFVKGDSVTLVNLYHSEARIYPPNAAMMNNRTDLGRMLATVPSSGIQNVELTTTDVAGGPELVVESGTYQMNGANNNVLDRGKYIVVWKQENGRWRIYRDIWNSDMPAQH